jgi:hypothetical protein
MEDKHDDIESLPITADYLERHGWKFDVDTRRMEKYPFDLKSRPDLKAWGLYIGNQRQEKFLQNIKYVHELQQIAAALGLKDGKYVYEQNESN